MPLLTKAEAVAASRRRSATVRLAEADLREPRGRPLTTWFDVFLSHSSEDAEVIAGVKAIMESEGMSVYVDWVDDPLTDRSKVTPATANLLRDRMNHSRFLIYASSTASSASRWMPWELGYFDGRRPGKVGILPIVSHSGASFVGVEYLGLYPTIEVVNFRGIGRRLGRISPSSAATLRGLASQR